MADDIALSSLGVSLKTREVTSTKHAYRIIPASWDGSTLTDASDSAPLPVKQPLAASATYGAPGTQPSTTARSILGANTARNRARISNAGSQIVYLGSDASVTSSTGSPLYPGDYMDFATYRGAIYGITASGTADTRYWED